MSDSPIEEKLATGTVEAGAILVLMSLLSRE